MKIVILERNSVGTDIDVSCYEKLGDVTVYANTVENQVAERVGDAEIIISNKAPMNEETLKEMLAADFSQHENKRPPAFLRG